MPNTDTNAGNWCIHTVWAISGPSLIHSALRKNPMKYQDGNEAFAGDKIEIGSIYTGVVVGCSLH